MIIPRQAATRGIETVSREVDDSHPLVLAPKCIYLTCICACECVWDVCVIVVAAVDSGDGCKFVSWNPSGETVSPDEHRSRLNVVLQIDRRGGLVRSAALRRNLETLPINGC